MRIDTFKNVLEEQGILLKAHTWESLIQEISHHSALPNPAVGSAWYQLGEVKQKLYEPIAPGPAIGFMKTNKEDLIQAVRFIKSRYSKEATEVRVAPKPKYVREWNEIIRSVDHARTTKKKGLRSTPHMDKFTEGKTSVQGITELLEVALEGNKDALLALKEVLINEPTTKDIPGHVSHAQAEARPGVVVIS